MEQARRKVRLKRGGELVRHELHEFEIVTQVKHDEIIAIDEALQKLEALHPPAAQLVGGRCEDPTRGARPG